MARADSADPSEKWVVGPLGERLTLDKLPSPKTRQWISRRKAEVVCAVEGGLLTLDEALQMYGLTLDEFAAWKRAMAHFGMRGLRATRVQGYRRRERDNPGL